MPSPPRTAPHRPAPDPGVAPPGPACPHAGASKAQLRRDRSAVRVTAGSPVGRARCVRSPPPQPTPAARGRQGCVATTAITTRGAGPWCAQRGRQGRRESARPFVETEEAASRQSLRRRGRSSVPCSNLSSRGGVGSGSRAAERGWGSRARIGESRTLARAPAGHGPRRAPATRTGAPPVLRGAALARYTAVAVSEG